MSLVVLSHEDTFPNEISIIVEMFQMGLERFHLRKPSFNKHELANYLAQIPIPFHSKISIHSHYTLSEEFNLGGIHLRDEGEEKKREYIEKYSSFDLKLTASYHSLDEFERSKLEFSYIFLSPIFSSISKENYRGTFDFEKMKLSLNSSKQNVIALGGIATGQIKTCKKLGFSACAFLGAIWKEKFPLMAFQKIQLEHQKYYLNKNL